jgi:hypothetical protein
MIEHKKVTQQSRIYVWLGKSFVAATLCLVIHSLPSILPQLTGSAASPADELQAKVITSAAKMLNYTLARIV